MKHQDLPFRGIGLTVNAQEQADFIRSGFVKKGLTTGAYKYLRSEFASKKKKKKKKKGF